MDFFQIWGYMLLGVQMSVYEGPAKSFFFTGIGLLQCYVLSNIFLLYKPSKYPPFTETHFCNLFTQSRKAGKYFSFGICWRH